MANKKSLRKAAGVRPRSMATPEKRIELQIESEKARLALELKRLSRHYERYYKDKRIFKEGDPKFIPLMMDFFKNNQREFMKRIEKEKEPAKILAALREAIVQVRTYIDFFGADRFVIPKEFVERMQARMKGWELGGPCDYRIVQADGKKTIVLEPKQIELEVKGKLHGNQEIVTSNPRTRLSPVIFHVHPSNSGPSNADRAYARHKKPLITIDKTGFRVDIGFPSLVKTNRETKYNYAVFTDVDVLPWAEIQKLRGIK